MVSPSDLGLNGCGVRDVSLVSPCRAHSFPPLLDFVVSKETPTIEANLGYKLFMMFAAINIGGMAVFSL